MSSIHRILDANYNRTKEALRVLEDLCRFQNNDLHAAKSLKRYRHQMTQSMLSLPVPYSKLLDARDSAADVGKAMSIHDLQRKLKPIDLIVANFKRAQESLRVLEEVVKIIGTSYSEPLRDIRFSLYDLEKKVFRKF